MTMHAFGLDAAITPPVVAGITTTTSGTSQSVSIPNAADGNRARCLMLTATGNCYIKFTKGAGTCTSTDMMVPANYPISVNCKQFDTYSVLQETAAAKINVVPIEV